jgi:aspartate racemase
MSEKVIGVLGGMGPEATVDCLRKIVHSTRAERDQDHLRVLVDSNAKVPDRTAAILGRGPSPVPALVASARLLERAGADFVVVPCVSAHVFLEEVRAQVRVPILSMFDVVAEAVAAMEPRVRVVGLLGTTGTINAGLFQRRLSLAGIDAIVPDEAGQARVMAAIYDVKDAAAARPRAAITADLVAAAEALAARGAQAIVAGCTEVPLALAQEDLRAPYVDSVLALARAAVLRAGGRPAWTG